MSEVRIPLEINATELLVCVAISAIVWPICYRLGQKAALKFIHVKEDLI